MGRIIPLKHYYPNTINIERLRRERGKVLRREGEKRSGILAFWRSGVIALKRYGRPKLLDCSYGQ